MYKYYSLISSNNFPVILQEFWLEYAEIWGLYMVDAVKIAVDSLLIPENGYSGIGFWVIKYRPTRKFKPSQMRRF